MIISADSIIAAIISKGITTNKKTLKEFNNESLNKSKFFSLKIKVPNLNPIPREIKTAGNSKIPWGKIFKIDKIPADLILIRTTNPNKNPFTAAINTEKTPNKIPKIRP